MPTYVYRCRGCENVFEEFQRITAVPGATCPACGKSDCTRKITGGAFHLKGSGWYASDYGAAPNDPAVSDSEAGDNDASDATSDNSTTTPASDPTSDSSTTTSASDDTPSDDVSAST